MHAYIHIPFCESKCPYCAFGSHDDAFGVVGEYFDALCFELKTTINHLFTSSESAKKSIKTIFFGGGTPSAVNARLYTPIFEILSPYLSKNCEITTEANPNSASASWLKTMRSFGVNRVSFGAQSFSEKKLKMLGRIHSPAATKNAVWAARDAGFDKINLDLIYGTRLDNKRLLDAELAAIAALPTTHISAYALTLEPSTPFAAATHLSHDSPTLARYLFKGLAGLGFKQYEISNFARKNGRCWHNISYWKGADYLGFGAYSVGTLGPKNAKILAGLWGALGAKNPALSWQNDYAKIRLNAPKNIVDYIKAPLNKNIEPLCKGDTIDERLFMGLRSYLGVPLKALNEAQQSRAQILIKSKKLYFKNGRIFAKNFLLSDEIFLFINQI